MRPLLALVPLTCVAWPLACLAVEGSARPAASPAFEKTVRPFVAKYCTSCHSEAAKTADVNLEAFRTPRQVLADPHTWEKVLQKLQTREMPPKGAPQPSAAEIKVVTGWVEGEFARAEREAPPNPGRVTARRLNRAEYNNTVRDLLGVEFRPADDFPQDDSGYGFDNIGDVLSLSPVLMEKYLAAAEKVARTAVFGPETMKPTLVRHQPPFREYQYNSDIPKEYDETGLTLPNALHVTHRFPVDGEYTFRVALSGERPSGSEPLHLALWLDGQRVSETTYDPEGKASFAIDRQDLAGQSTDFRVRARTGERWVAITVLRNFEGLPARYGGPNPSKRPEPPPPMPPARFFEPPPNATPEQIEEFRQRRERFLARQRDRTPPRVPTNATRIRLVEISGPYQQETGPSLESRLKLYACGHLDGKHAEGCDRTILRSLARRAFRRPVAEAELERYLGLARMAREQGDSFEEGLCVAIQGLLVSPHFLFRIERDHGPEGTAEPRPVGQHELASRLSYFVWSSMPDDTLLRCADAGLLRKPQVLEAQVRRMLRDPRSRALVENFGGQWLELRKLESAKPDPERFPEWDDYLKLSARRETELFLEELVRKDGSILELLDADYTFLNERLARFYGIDGVRGPQFRRVELADSPRGGVLTHASVLTVSSYSTRTSPVLRGRWILENILNAPPPPPPPGVPALDEAKLGEEASLREQLEVHRTNPTCASCHSRMDPLGFALENFNAIGAWREKDGKFPVDSSGKLPDGREFQGAAELKKVLMEDRDAFARGLSEKLLTYALGRGLERYDQRTVRAIAARLPERDYRFSALVLEIARSLPFQMTLDSVKSEREDREQRAQAQGGGAR
ncbi:MAG: DUF1592 domain-containing protein [Armatimonadota bacterium]